MLRVIAGWYQQTDERAEQIRNDPAMLEMIEDRRRSSPRRLTTADLPESCRSATSALCTTGESVTIRIPVVETGCRLDLVRLADRPWAAPSTPMLPAEGQPTEIRSVKVPDTGITVVYQHDHDSGRVDLLYVGREA